MGKLNLQIATEQISSGMYSYNDMIKIVSAIIEGFESEYPEYDSPAGKFKRKLENAIEQWTDNKRGEF